MAVKREPMPPGPAPKGGVKLTREEMTIRDTAILTAFIGGASEYAIARQVGLTRARVNAILKREIGRGTQHRELLRDEARAVQIGRLETLIRAVWPAAIRGDLRAIETARKVCEAEARVCGVGAGAAGAPRVPADDDIDIEFDGDDPLDQDELARYRRARRRRRGEGV
jgi:hypothetical protein